MDKSKWWKIGMFVIPAMLLVVGILPFISLSRGDDCTSADCSVRSVFKGGRLDGNISRVAFILRLKKELFEALENATKDGNVAGEEMKEYWPEDSFQELVVETVYRNLDMHSFMSKAKSLVMRMQMQLLRSRKQELEYARMVIMGVPSKLECLYLKLTEEYYTNNEARGLLTPPVHVHRLFNKSYHHVAILSDNLLAARVAVASAIRASSQPEKMVFHVVTDRITFISMYALFALNPVGAAALEVKGLHQFHLSEKVTAGIMEMMASHRAIQQHWLDKYDTVPSKERVNVRRTCHISLLNHVKMYLPELFPELDKILYLDDDVVVQKDLSPLWSLDLNERVNGAVRFWNKPGFRPESICPGGRMTDHLNFSSPEISSSALGADECPWLYGVNIFDLDAWRATNITRDYHKWLKLNQDMDFVLWRIGALPPAMLAFGNHMYTINHTWHLVGLGKLAAESISKTEKKLIEAAAVLHFSGPAKPWLPVASPLYSSLWDVHVDHSNEILHRCETQLL